MSNLMRWEPFGDLISLREAMNRLFDESIVQPWGALARAGWGEGLPVDMYETDEAVVVKAAMPGVKADDVDISVIGDSLTIRGEAKREEEVKKEHYVRRERYVGTFSRTLSLPARVVADKAEAVFEDGVLTLTLPKSEEVKPKAIKVRTKK